MLGQPLAAARSNSGAPARSFLTGALRAESEQRRCRLLLVENNSVWSALHDAVSYISHVYQQHELARRAEALVGGAVAHGAPNGCPGSDVYRSVHEIAKQAQNIVRFVLYDLAMNGLTRAAKPVDLARRAQVALDATCVTVRPIDDGNAACNGTSRGYCRCWGAPAASLWLVRLFFMCQNAMVYLREVRQYIRVHEPDILFVARK